MPSEAFQAIVTMMESMPTLDMPIAERRASVEENIGAMPRPDGVSYEEVDAAGVPSEWVTPDAGAPNGTILYLHGGAYTICSPRTHRGLTGHLALQSGTRVLVPDYRLAPEHPFPAAIDDAIAVYRWLLDGGTDPARLGIAGDSAGGGLTMATLLSLRDAGLPLPKVAVALSPWTDLEMTGESMTSKADVDPMIKRERLKDSVDAYLNGIDVRTPLASPIYADLTGLPPLFIHVGGRETLLDDATRLADRARADGVDVTVEVVDDMIHVWHLFAGLAPECDDGIRRVAAFLGEHLS